MMSPEKLEVYTISVFFQDSNGPVVYKDIYAESDDAAVEFVMLGLPVKRQVRAIATVTQ